jgi:hypothetical protein
LLLWKLKRWEEIGGPRGEERSEISFQKSKFAR